MSFPEIHISNRTSRALAIVVLTTYRCKVSAGVGMDLVLDKIDLHEDIELIEIIIEEKDHGQEE